MVANNKISSSKNDLEKPKKMPWSKLIEPLVLLAPGGLWLTILLLLPTLIIFELSLVEKIRPGDIVIPNGIGNYLKVVDQQTILVLGRSVFFAFGTTIVALLLGFPVAYWIGQMAPAKWRNLLLLGFVLPLFTSSLLRSYAWVTILRPTGFFNTLITSPNVILSHLGLPSIPYLDIFNNSTAVFIGMGYSYLPYIVLILYASVEKLDKRLLEASADLGANPVQTFVKVTVPQTLPGIVAGSLLVFINTLGDFVDPELLGGASSMTASRLIYNQFLGSTQNWGFGSALSMVLIMAVSIAIALLIKYGDTADN
ncbi:MAG TPA: ABC transporter permease [Allocoleopsis sp.]